MRRHIESGHRFSAFRERVGKPTDRGPQRRLVELQWTGLGVLMRPGKREHD